MMEDTPIIPPHVADGPAGLMSHDDWKRHMEQTVVIVVLEPKLNLSQGSFLRCSRGNVSATIATILRTAPGDVHLRVEDGFKACDLRREALLQKETK